MPPVNAPASADAGQLVRDPVYRQLASLLLRLIRSGEFRPGQRFLTERDVSERFGANRLFLDGRNLLNAPPLAVP